MKKAEIEELKRIASDLQWMARRYADGRFTYAPSIVNQHTRRLQQMGVSLNPTADKIIWARDGHGRQHDKLTPREATPGTPEAMGELSADGRT